MVGQVQFVHGAKGMAEKISLYGCPVMRVQTDPNGWLGRRRMHRAGRTLQQKGVLRTLLPLEFSDKQWLAQWGLRTIDTAPFLCSQSPRLAEEGLQRCGVSSERAVVALCASHSSRGIMRAAQVLGNIVPYLVIDIPHGGQELAHWLRWEYGIPMMPPEEPAHLALQYQPICRMRTEKLTLKLYGDTPDLAGILPTMTELPVEERNSVPLLALLWEWGKLESDTIKFL